MPPSIELPQRDRTLREFAVPEPRRWHARSDPFTSRIAFAAAHVVSDPLAAVNPLSGVAIDWDATLAYRRYLWSQGFAVAEAMDTAQRGGGLDWESARRLIRLSIAEARAVGGRIACGAGTDHLRVSPGLSSADVQAAYEEQCSAVEREGGQVILMASRALAACAKGPEDYASVYGAVLGQLARPAILHWLGDMFDPALAGYWGCSDIGDAMGTCLEIIAAHRGKIDGIKISLLDSQREVEMRRRLPEGVRMYTGDDFHYDELILGDERGFSDALLGIFDPIAPAAAAALRALDDGDVAGYREILLPTVALSRHLFEAPTSSYKTGVIFLAYINGHQDHFHMLGGQQGARSIVHLSELFELAGRAGLICDPDLAGRRMRAVLALAGVTGS